MTEGYVRGTRQKERLARLRENAPKDIRVVPRDASMRRLLKHPSRGGFPDKGGAAWPPDRYTKRRLADGSVLREEQVLP